jgi:serine/threonine protein phosphatase 1
MTKTYAIADIHGRVDLLLAAYARLEGEEPGLIVHLGDYVDRGRSSSGVINCLMDDTTIPPGFHRLVLKGNHEQTMVETIRKPLNPGWWMGNGGDRTLMSYGHPKIRIRYNDIWPYNPSVVPPEHVDFLNALPRYFCDRHRVYVHAGLDTTVSLPEQKDDVLFWVINKGDIGYGYQGLNNHIVHGHHEHDEPQLLKNRTNLDVGGWRTNRLVIGVFDDDVPGGPIEIIGVKA